jgi:serine/threonine protein kinase
VALKVINMFDKSKRDQLMEEIKTLYDAACPSIVGFYGAFYRDGTISIALEFMNGGRYDTLISLPQWFLF